MTDKFQEIELKFHCDIEGIKKLRRAQKVKDVATGNWRSRLLRAIYHDTADLALKRAGIALRTRKEGRYWVQTIKCNAKMHAGLSRVDEYHVRLRNEQLDLERIEDMQVRQLLEKACGGMPLTPVFETIIRRQYVQVAGPTGGVVEVSLDAGEVVVGGLIAPITEVEMELVQGPLEDLFQLAGGFMADIPFSFSSSNKASVGYGMLVEGRATQAMPLHAKDFVLTDGANTEIAYRDALRACLKQISHNLHVTRVSDHPEGPHQLRVGLRRLRSVFRVFKDVADVPEMRFLDGEARWLASQVGRLRDLDVLRDDIVAPVAKIRTEDQGFAQLAHELALAWDEAAPLVRANINAPRVGVFLLRLQAYCEGRGWIQMGDFTQTMRLARPISIHAELTLDRLRRKCAKKAKKLEQLSIEQRHDLRKELKKLRYASDFFLCLYPKKKSEKFLKSLKKLQNIFGYLNDVAMAEELVARHGHKSPEISMALGYLLGWHHGEAEKAFAHARVAWNNFAATKAFWL